MPHMPSLKSYSAQSFLFRLSVDYQCETNQVIYLTRKSECPTLNCKKILFSLFLYQEIIVVLHLPICLRLSPLHINIIPSVSAILLFYHYLLHFLNSIISVCQTNFWFLFVVLSVSLSRSHSFSVSSIFPSVYLFFLWCIYKGKCGVNREQKKRSFGEMTRSSSSPAAARRRSPPEVKSQDVTTFLNIVTDRFKLHMHYPGIRSFGGRYFIRICRDYEQEKRLTLSYI